MRVLLAEDDLRLGKLIQYMLEQNDISVEWVPVHACAETAMIVPFSC